MGKVSIPNLAMSAADISITINTGVGEVRCAATEELRQGNEFFSPYADLEARCAFDLHQQAR